MPDLFIPNPSDLYFPFSEDWEIAQWIDEGGAVVTQSLYTDDADHPLCMEVVSDTDAKGVYNTVADVLESTKYAFELSYRCAATMELDYLVYDNTGSATIASGTLTKTVWSYHYEEFTTPANCVEIIIYLRAGTGTGAAFYVDDLSLQGNVIALDPDTFQISYPKSGHTRPTLNGTLRNDTVLTTVEIDMSFPILTSLRFDRLLNFHKSRRETYFDDQAVPPMTERGVLYTETQYDFVGITKASGPEFAYEDKSALQPDDQGDFESNEIETADYQVLDDDDNNSYQDGASTTGHHVYHKFVFDCSGEYTNAAQVRSFEITYKGKSNDASASNLDGVTLYAWNVNAENWVKLGSTQVSTKETISLSLMKPEQAQMFVEPNGEINILAQSNGVKGAGDALTIDSYYIEVTVNKGLSDTITLLNRAVLSAGDVISVKNLTDFTNRTLTTHYTIGDNGKSVIMVSEDAGDVIEVKYNQYYRVSSISLSERRLATATPTTPDRSATMRLRGLIGLE